MVRAGMIALAVGFLASGLSAGQAQGPKLNLRTGLWKMTTSMQRSGMPPIPPEMLSHMSPEQRQQLEAHMQQSMGRRDQTRVVKHCVTQQNLDRGFDLGRPQNENCRRTIRSQTAHMVDATEECTGREAMTGTIHLESPTPETFYGTIDILIGNGSRHMTVHQTMQGEWLSADCGQVKPQD